VIDGFDPAVPWALLPWVLALALGVLAWWIRGRVRRGNRRRGRRARAAEDAADAVLHAHGYRVEDVQVSVRWTMRVDGQPVEVLSRADRLVRRGRRRFVAEIKSGPRASDPALPATRRQLIEYAHAFGVDGVVLVDMDRGRVSEVSFPTRMRRRILRAANPAS